MLAFLLTFLFHLRLIPYKFLQASGTKWSQPTIWERGLGFGFGVGIYVFVKKFFVKTKKCLCLRTALIVGCACIVKQTTYIILILISFLIDIFQIDTINHCEVPSSRDDPG